jgi:4-amino-4-deoxy-L-arabinose transferase-like glycosyltransferase
VLLWILPLWSSLWLDETITYWVVKDGPSALFSRSLLYNAQSPAYFVIAWAAVAVGGAREWVLRIPSVFAAAVSTVLVYRLALRFGDREMGALAAVCFASYWLVADAAITARGYATGLLVLIGAVVALDRWLYRRHTADWAAYVILSVLTVYIQPLFAIMYVVHVVHTADRVRRRTAEVGWSSAVVTAGTVGLLLVPLAVALPPVWQRRMWMAAVSGATFRGWGDIRFALAPLAIVASSALLERRLPAHYLRVPAPLILLLCWAAVPVLMIVVAARWMSPTVLVSRYFLCAAPAIALIMAWAIRGVRSSRIRLALVTMVVGLSVLGMGIGVERLEDWRSALHAAAAATKGKAAPVLVGAGFIESARLRWPVDPEEAGYLVSPVAFYHVPGAAIPLPYDLGHEGTGYLRHVSMMLAKEGGPFVLVVDTHRFFGGQSVFFADSLEHSFAPMGFFSRSVGRFGTISVVIFESASEAGGPGGP